MHHLVLCTDFLCRYTERSNLEIQLFNIQMKLRASRQKTWYPPEGKLVSDINKVFTVYECVCVMCVYDVCVCVCVCVCDVWLLCRHG